MPGRSPAAAPLALLASCRRVLLALASYFFCFFFFPDAANEISVKCVVS